MGARINITQFRKEFDAQSSRVLGQLAKQNIESKLQDAKTELLESVEYHPVSQEIKGGPEGEPIAGLTPQGNLFSFIGFKYDQTPVENFVDFLDKEIKLKRSVPKIVRNGSKIKYEFEASLPTRDEITDQTLMPWEPRSWVYAVEEGISGIGSYIYHRFLGGSRSGTGLQARKKSIGGRFQNTKYFSEMWNKFLSRLGKR